MSENRAKKEFIAAKQRIEDAEQKANELDNILHAYKIRPEFEALRNYAQVSAKIMLKVTDAHGAERILHLWLPVERAKNVFRAALETFIDDYERGDK